MQDISTTAMQSTDGQASFLVQGIEAQLGLERKRKADKMSTEQANADQHDIGTIAERANIDQQAEAEQHDISTAAEQDNIDQQDADQHDISTAAEQANFDQQAYADQHHTSTAAEQADFDQQAEADQHDISTAAEQANIDQQDADQRDINTAAEHGYRPDQDGIMQPSDGDSESSSDSGESQWDHNLNLAVRGTSSTGPSTTPLNWRDLCPRHVEGVLPRRYSHIYVPRSVAETLQSSSAYRQPYRAPQYVVRIYEQVEFITYFTVAE